jgi:hypothetical protein
MSDSLISGFWLGVLIGAVVGGASYSVLNAGLAFGVGFVCLGVIPHFSNARDTGPSPAAEKTGRQYAEDEMTKILEEHRKSKDGQAK